MLPNNRIILIILTTMLISTPLADITDPSVYAQQEMTTTQTFETQEQYNKIVISADGKHIAAIGNTTDTLSVFNRTHMLWSTPIPGITSIAISENASLIAAAATSGLYLFGIENSIPQLHYDLSWEKPLIALSDDGTTLGLAATTADQIDTASTRLYLFETRNQNPTWNTTVQGTLESLSISGNGNYTTVCTSQPGALYLYSKQQPIHLWTYSFGEKSGAAKISNNGNHIIATGGNLTDERSLRVYRFSHQSPQPNYIKIISELPPTQQLSVSSQGSIFTLGFAETSRLIFFNLDLPPYGYGPGSVLNISLPSKPTSMSMSHEGKYTAIGTNTGIYIYEYMNSRLNLTKQYTLNNPAIADTAITPNGWHLTAAANEHNSTHNTIYLFNVEEIRNGDPTLWLRVTILTLIILIGLTASIYLLRRKHKPQKPTNAI